MPFRCKPPSLWQCWVIHSVAQRLGNNMKSSLVQVVKSVHCVNPFLWEIELLWLHATPCLGDPLLYIYTGQILAVQWSTVLTECVHVFQGLSRARGFRFAQCHTTSTPWDSTYYAMLDINALRYTIQFRRTAGVQLQYMGSPLQEFGLSYPRWH